VTTHRVTQRAGPVRRSDDDPVPAIAMLRPSAASTSVKRARDAGGDTTWSAEDASLCKRAHLSDAQTDAVRGMSEEARARYLASLRAWDAATRVSAEIRAARVAARHALETQCSEDGLVTATPDATDDSKGSDMDGAHERAVATTVFSQCTLAAQHNHPHAIVESTAMATVSAPELEYEADLPPEARSALSGAQLEAVERAGAAHSRRLDEDVRCGFFIGDGTGVGKGREAAAIILDCWHRTGGRRHVWISASTALLHDAQRDLTDLGCGADVPLQALHRAGRQPGAEALGAGIVFCTYATLISTCLNGPTRAEQLDDWMRADGGAFDGVLVLDEAHRAKNLHGTRTADAVVALQERHPAARVVYMSATAGVTAKDLGYMTRLGLWRGPSAPFRGFVDFAKAFGDVSRLELLCQDLKARGLMVARMLAFDGCTVETIKHALSDAERDLYDRAAEWWHRTLKTVTRDEHRPTLARDVFAACLGFFKQLINALKCKTIVACIDAALARGDSVVVGLQATGESRAADALERGETGLTSTPFEIAHALVDGLADAAVRAERVAALRALALPPVALDALLMHYGTDAVAELTGRRTRAVPARPGGACVSAARAVLEGGGGIEAVNLAEKRAFMEGRKRIAILSDAASCGISLHADARCANQQRRVHITLEMAWSAEKMLQQFGRTHRASQTAAPHYVMAVTDVAGEQRFASAIARKLESLGAITRGDRRGGHALSSDLIAHNLDTPSGHAALTRLQTRAMCDPALRRVFDRMVLDPAQKNTVNRFLNRLLLVPIAEQRRLYDVFFRLVQQQVTEARHTEDHDIGVSEIATRRFKAGAPQAVEGHPGVSLVPHWIREGTDWSEVEDMMASRGAVVLRHRTTRRVVLAWREEGAADWSVVRPSTHLSDAAFCLPARTADADYERVEEVRVAEALWKRNYPTARSIFLLCGALLPLWTTLETFSRSHGRSGPSIRRIGARIGIVLTPEEATALCAQLGGDGAASNPMSAHVPGDSDDEYDEADDDEAAALVFASATAPSSAARSHGDATVAMSDASDDEDEEGWDELLACIGD